MRGHINYLRHEKIPYIIRFLGMRYGRQFKLLHYHGKNPFLVFLRRLLKMPKFFALLFDSKHYIRFLTLISDTDCTYRCEGCGQHTPQILAMPPEEREIDIDRLLESTDKVLEAVDGVAGISVASGEGFKNKNLLKIIDYCSKKPKIISMNIPTNGTVIPEENVLEAMKRHDVSATITKYEVTPQEQIDKLAALFDKYGIRYTVYIDRTWYKVSPFKPVEDSPRNHKKKFLKCERFWLIINNDELWKCVCYATAVFCGINEKRDEDFVNVSNVTADELRNEIIRVNRLGYLYQCTQCTGYYGKHKVTIPAGVQMQDAPQVSADRHI